MDNVINTLRRRRLMYTMNDVAQNLSQTILQHLQSYSTATHHQLQQIRSPAVLHTQHTAMSTLHSHHTTECFRSQVLLPWYPKDCLELTVTCSDHTKIGDLHENTPVIIIIYFLLLLFLN